MKKEKDKRKYVLHAKATQAEKDMIYKYVGMISLSSFIRLAISDYIKRNPGGLQNKGLTSIIGVV